MRGLAIAVVFLVVGCWKSSPSPSTTGAGHGGKRPPTAGAMPRAEHLAVWSDNRTPSPRGNHQIFASRMLADGTVVDPQGIAVDTRPHRAPANLLVGETPGGWWIASELTESAPSAPVAWTVSVSAHRVDAKGGVGSPVQVSDMMRDKIDLDLATAGEDALVAWAGVRRTKVEAAVITGGQKAVVALPANTGRRPTVTFDVVTDSFVLVYREPTATTVVVIDRGGTIRTTLAIPGAGARIEDGARVVPLGTGEVLVTWVEADEHTLTAARIDVATATLTARQTLYTGQGTLLRHRLAHGPRGFLLTWHEQSPRGTLFNAAMLDSDPLAVAPRMLAWPIARPDEMPRVQASDRGFLVTWLNAGEPYALRLDGDGNVLDTAPVSLRGVRAEPVPTATLQAALDVVARNGADYCPARGNDRSVPPTVRGLYVVEGTQPWGTLYIPGFGWGGSTGSRPRLSLYVGRGPEFVPHFRSRASTAHPFELTVEIPDTKRKRTERFPIDSDDAASAAAAGVAGPLDIVDFEANGGLGGRGMHFVITKATVVENAAALSPRFTAARAELDKLVKASRKDLDKVLAEAKRVALAANPHPQKGAVPLSELVIYVPTYRPSTGRIEILFGYRLTEGVMMKFPPPKPNPNPHVKRPDGPPPPNPRPLTWAVMMGARFTLDGDKIVQQEVWAPTVVGADQRAVPWQCEPPQGHPALAANTPACVGPPPDKTYTCVRDCGSPAPSDTDPPPGWSWLSPQQAASRQQHGCPICLPGSARVATPDGDAAIDTLAVGARVLTLDDEGRRVPATVLHAGSTLAGSAHRVVRVELADGRVVLGSPGHPHAAGGTLGELRAGDVLDGARITRVEQVPLPGDRTWDILPSGPTGLYIIDGVVLRSSFAQRRR